MNLFTVSGLLFLVLFATFSHGLDIDAVGDIFAQISANFDGDLNLGSGVALLLDSVISLSASSSVSGTVQLGNNGILGLITSTPTLAIDAGATLTCGAYVHLGGELEGAGELVVNGSATFEEAATVAVSSFLCASASFQEDVEIAGQFIVEGASEIQSGVALTVDASASAKFEGDVTGTGSLEANGEVTFEANAEADAEATINCLADVVVGAAGSVVVKANTTFAAAVEIANSFAVEAEKRVTFSGEVTVDAEGSVEIEGDCQCSSSASMALAAGSLLSAAGAVELDCDVSGSGSIEFDSTEARDSIITAASITANVAVKGAHRVRVAAASAVSGTTVAALNIAGEAQAYVESKATVQGNLDCEGSGALHIEAGGSVVVSGNASFSASATYEMVAETATSTSHVVVEGAANLGGNLVFMTDVEFDADTEITIIEYASRVDASVFASFEVMSTSGKRALNQDDYDVDYQEDKAVMKSKEGSTSPAPEDTTGAESPEGNALAITTSLVATAIILAF